MHIYLHVGLKCIAVQNAEVENSSGNTVCILHSYLHTFFTCICTCIVQNAEVENSLGALPSGTSHSLGMSLLPPPPPLLCTALHCTIVHCKTLHCCMMHFVLQCTVIYCNAPKCTIITPHCTVIQCTHCHCAEFHCLNAALLSSAMLCYAMPLARLLLQMPPCLSIPQVSCAHVDLYFVFVFGICLCILQMPL